MLKTKNCTVGTLLQRYNCGRLVELKNPFAKVSLAACLCICVHTCFHPFQKVTLCLCGTLLQRWHPFSKVAFCQGGTLFQRLHLERWHPCAKVGPFFQRLHFAKVGLFFKGGALFFKGCISKGGTLLQRCLQQSEQHPSARQGCQLYFLQSSCLRAFASSLLK